MEKQLLGLGLLVLHAVGVAMERKATLDLNFLSQILQLGYYGHRALSRVYSALLSSSFTHQLIDKELEQKFCFSGLVGLPTGERKTADSPKWRGITLEMGYPEWASKGAWPELSNFTFLILPRAPEHQLPGETQLHGEAIMSHGDMSCSP